MEGDDIGRKRINDGLTERETEPCQGCCRNGDKQPFEVEGSVVMVEKIVTVIVV